MDRPEFLDLMGKIFRHYVVHVFTIYNPYRNKVPEFLHFETFDFNHEFLSAQIRYLSPKRKIREITHIYTDIFIKTYIADKQRTQQFLTTLANYDENAVQPDPADLLFKLPHHMIILNLASEMGKHSTPSHLSTAKDLTWSECFTICASVTLAMAITKSKESFDIGENQYEMQAFIHDSYTGPIYQALTLAATLSEKQNVWLEASNSYRKFNGKKGGNKKASRFGPLKRKIIHLTDTKYAHLSKGLTIAKRILGSGYAYHDFSLGDLSQNDFRDSRGNILTEGNELATIAKWINAHLKTKTGD